MKINPLILGGVALGMLIQGCTPSTSDETKAMPETNTTSTATDLKNGASNAWQKTKEVTTNAWQNTKQTAVEAWTDIQDSLSPTADYAYDKKDEFVAKAKENLAALDKKIQELSDRSATASDPIKADAETKLVDLRAQRTTLDDKLTAVGQATQDGWNDAKAAFKSAYDSTKAATHQAWDWLTDKIKSS